MLARPFEALVKGVALLEPLLRPHGFVFVHRDSSHGSGGDFAWGEFERDDRRLELHYRHTLGLVVYHSGMFWLDHIEYMRALGVPDDKRQYPGFGGDPSGGFEHLAHDLGLYATDFLQGDASTLTSAAAAAEARRAREYRVDAAKYEGDDRKRRDARASFRRGEYNVVINLLEALHYPDLLHDSERRMLEIARVRRPT